MKLKYTTRHLNFYFLKIHILRPLLCVYIVGMAGFVLASRRNDGQETNKKSFGKSNNKLFGKSNDFFPNTSQKKDLSKDLLKTPKSKSNNKVEKAILDLQETLWEASKSNRKASKFEPNSDVKRAAYNLVRMNASVDPTDTNKWTPLMFFTKKGSVDNINLLVNAGADVNAINNKNETAIMIAAKNNKHRAVENLLRHGANVTPAYCNTALTRYQKQKCKILREKLTQTTTLRIKAIKKIEDLLYLRLACDHMKNTGLGHIDIHRGNGVQILANGVARRWKEDEDEDNNESKTIFPSEWSDEETVEAITSVLHNPETLGQVNPTKFVAEGNFKDVSIKVFIKVVKKKQRFTSNEYTQVITAFPLSNEKDETAYLLSRKSEKVSKPTPEPHI